jgi:hypothetical protein
MIGPDARWIDLARPPKGGYEQKRGLAHHLEPVPLPRCLKQANLFILVGEIAIFDLSPPEGERRLDSSHLIRSRLFYAH